MKTERRRKDDIKEYFENIYSDYWDAPFVEIQNPPNEPKKTRFLLVDWHTYASIKEKTEKTLHLNLPEVPPFQMGSETSLPRAVRFQSSDAVEAYLKELYDNNIMLKNAELLELAKGQLEQVVNIVNGTGGSLFAMDVESWELNSKYILEIGVTKWYPQGSRVPVTRHFILEENQDKRNGKHCPDNRDNFAYGKSEILPTAKVLQELRDITNDVSLWVFHYATAELSYLKKLGLPSPHTLVDTQCISYLIPGRNGLMIGLEDLLKELQLPVTHMHNAGNDAHCTMVALLALVAKYGGQ